MKPSVQTSEWCKTRTGLPAAIPCSKNTLDRCMLLDGFPKRDRTRGYRLEACRAFIQANTTKGAPPANLQAARAEHELVKIEQRREQVAILKGDHFPRQQGIDAHIRIGAALNSALASAEASLPARLLGLGEAAMQLVLRGEFDQMRADLSNAFHAYYRKRRRALAATTQLS